MGTLMAVPGSRRNAAGSFPINLGAEPLGRETQFFIALLDLTLGEFLGDVSNFD